MQYEMIILELLTRIKKLEEGKPVQYIVGNVDLNEAYFVYEVIKE